MSNLFGPPVYVAGADQRLIAFTLSVTQTADDSGRLNSSTGVAAELAVGRAQLPVSLDMIDGQIAGGKTGSAEATGVDSFVASVPAHEHSVVLELTEAGYTQQFNLWSSETSPSKPSHSLPSGDLLERHRHRVWAIPPELH